MLEETTMNKVFRSFALSGLLVAGVAAYAQTDAATAQQPATGTTTQDNTTPHGGRHMRKQNPDRQMKMLTKRLELTSDQQTQIKPILEDRAQQMQALRADQSAARADKMAKMKSLRDDSNQKIEAVLNDTQKQKFEAIQQKMQERMQNHRHNHDGADTAPAPQG